MAPKKPAKEEKPEIVEAQATPEVVESVKKCECGEPVALELGQTEVCAAHIRRG